MKLKGRNGGSEGAGVVIGEVRSEKVKISRSKEA